MFKLNIINRYFQLVFFSVCLLSSYCAISAERELAIDGELASLIIDDNYRCGNEAIVRVNAKSASYFDESDKGINRAVNAARVILNFECPKISKITLVGYTDGKEIYKADSEKKYRWELRTFPSRLEWLALFFSTAKPSYTLLGAMSSELAPYRDVTGIFGTYQYDFYEQEIIRFLDSLVVDEYDFRAYLEYPEIEFGSYEKADDHYRAILGLIETYYPDEYPLFKGVYDDVSSDLKNLYWEARVIAILDEEKPFSEITKATVSMVERYQSKEFTVFVDNYISQLAKEELNFFLERLVEAPLEDIQWASDYLDGMPDTKPLIARLPNTASIIEELGDKVASLTSNRLQELKVIADEIIRDSGGSYSEVDTVLETGFALANEFEASGFEVEAQRLIADTTKYIKTLLINDLDAFNQNINSLELELDAEKTIELQQQAALFGELSTQFEEYKQYQNVITTKLKKQKDSLCSKILLEAGAWNRDLEKTVVVGDKNIGLPNLACDLLANGHVIEKFSIDWAIPPNSYTMTIKEKDETKRSIELKTVGMFYKQTLRLSEDVTSNNNGDVLSDSQLENYITKLILPPPNGIPDANGIRECDRFAGDPHDPKKLSDGLDLTDEDLDLDILDHAIDACIAAVENDPNDSRQQFQLARLFWNTGNLEEAKEYMRLSAQNKYPAAIYYSAEMILSESTDNNSFVDALEMYAAAGKAGYKPGNDMVKQLNPDGIDFYREIPAPTKNELLDAISYKGKNVSSFGMSASLSLVDVNINDCFQTSATKFSCEYKPVYKCSMGTTWGRDMALLINLFSNVAAASCNNEVYEEFSTFQKLSDGKWKELPNNT